MPTDCPDRRAALGGLLAALAASPALAHRAPSKPVFTPEELAPAKVRLATALPEGEIHVVPATFSLYWTLPGRQALRFRVGIARRGLYHPGRYRVGRKARWPRWTPTRAMIRRNPAYRRWARGMPGGPGNPLGARALYLFRGRRDTFLRIHGTDQPHTIGTRVSNGCARLLNAHIVMLYDLVPVGTPVVLHPVTRA